MSEGIESLPTEILIHIFTLVKPIQLARCRLVCKTWKFIVDSLSYKDRFWLANCKTDFPNMYLSAYNKRLPGLNWCNIYRSLTLWPYLPRAEESMDEFASASRNVDEIMGFQILRHGVIGIHTLKAINFYDLETLKPARRSSISGTYERYEEDHDTIVVQGSESDLYVVRKFETSLNCDTKATFFKIKFFTLTDSKLFFVSKNEEVCLCNLNEEKLEMIVLCTAPTPVMSIGVSDGHLNLLTYERSIYTVVGRTLVHQLTLGHYHNLLHQFKKYNFLENIRWSDYYHWLHILNQPIPPGALGDIKTMKTYGEAVFIGTNEGLLFIYYSPYMYGHFDIYNTNPVKQYNFTERKGFPVLSQCQILKIDVIESEDGHMVLIAMPKKIAVLKYKHSFIYTQPNSLIPYGSVQINC